MPSPQSNPLRILFVEDNEYLRETIAALLEAADREVVSCGSAEQALREFSRCRCDVLITDVSLGGMSGIDLARAVLRIEPGAWVVISSGYAFDHGLDALGPRVSSLPKPFELDDLDALLDRVRAARDGS